MKPRDRQRLSDIVKAADLVASFTDGYTLETFKADQLVQSAVLRQIQITGEACRQLSDDFKSNNPEVPWARIIGMRNLVVHNYDIVDTELVWSVVESFLPDARAQIERFLRAHGAAPPD